MFYSIISFCGYSIKKNFKQGIILLEKQTKKHITDKNVMGQYSSFPIYQFLPNSPTVSL